MVLMTLGIREKKKISLHMLDIVGILLKGLCSVYSLLLQGIIFLRIYLGKMKWITSSILAKGERSCIHTLNYTLSMLHIGSLEYARNTLTFVTTTIINTIYHFLVHTLCLELAKTVDDRNDFVT